MQSRVVLVSDDSDFFDYIHPKLMLRKYDELFRFSFDELPEKIHMLTNAVIIANSEEVHEKALELLKLAKNMPVIIFSFNEDEDFRTEAYKEGAFDYFTISTSDEEMSAKITSALNISSSLDKSNFYREILVSNNLIMENNEVYTNHINLLDKEIEKIKNSGMRAVLLAISPNDKSKFLIKPHLIETVILNNIRKNDVLMNFATNKYFLLLYDTDVDSAEKIWSKIRSFIPEKIYAGIALVKGMSREYVVNEALSKLHESINHDSNSTQQVSKSTNKGNFKIFRKEFNKKLEKTILPVFYHIQQKYNDKLYGMNIEQGVSDGYGCLHIKSRYADGSFKITYPGFSIVNIDIAYQSNPNTDNKKKFPVAKRISLEPNELEQGLLEDLLEQFILEFKNEVSNDYS